MLLSHPRGADSLDAQMVERLLQSAVSCFEDKASHGRDINPADMSEFIEFNEARARLLNCKDVEGVRILQIIKAIAK